MSLEQVDLGPTCVRACCRHCSWLIRRVSGRLTGVGFDPCVDYSIADVDCLHHGGHLLEARDGEELHGDWMDWRPRAGGDGKKK